MLQLWPRADPSDPFLCRLQWLQALTYDAVLAALHPSKAPDDPRAAQAAATILAAFQVCVCVCNCVCVFVFIV
jgi:hypothetical protein